MRTKLTLVAAASTLVLAGSFGLTACSGSTDSASTATATASEAATEAAAEDGAATFTEYDVVPGDNIRSQKDGLFDAALVYFQPVDMEPTGAYTPASESSFHIEVDVTSADAETGYPVGDFIPGMTVHYEITDRATGKVVNNGKQDLKGTFMQMVADDGPHYGANIYMPEAGSYTVTITLESPTASGWVYHVDADTGMNKDKIIPAETTLTWDWDYTPVEW